MFKNEGFCKEADMLHTNVNILMLHTNVGLRLVCDNFVFTIIICIVNTIKCMIFF